MMRRRRPKWSTVAIALAVIAAVAVAVPAFGVSSSIKKAIKKEVSKQISRATGPQGAQGAQGVQGPQGAGGTEAWHEVGATEPGFNCPGSTFCPGWTNLNPTGFSTGAYLRDPAGIVHLKGLVKQTFLGEDDPATIFVLPAGYRPEPVGKAQVFPANSNDAFASIYIFGSGGVRVQVGAPATWVSLDGISFRCQPSGANGCP